MLNQVKIKVYLDSRARRERYACSICNTSLAEVIVGLNLDESLAKPLIAANEQLTKFLHNHTEVASVPPALRRSFTSSTSLPTHLADFTQYDPFSLAQRRTWSGLISVSGAADLVIAVTTRAVQVPLRSRSRHSTDTKLPAKPVGKLPTMNDGRLPWQSHQSSTPTTYRSLEWKHRLHRQLSVRHLASA